TSKPPKSRPSKLSTQSKNLKFKNKMNREVRNREEDTKVKEFEKYST
ncbi:3605_t:CDS:2, partial [Gigaspora rosea]